jgi:hypothetical protein
VTAFDPATSRTSPIAPIRERVEREIDEALAAFPDPGRLSAGERRGIIARYTAVLEGNFIYWMTGALLSIRSEEARSIILQNLHDEVRGAHPNMLRRFAVAARAFPTDSDALAVDPALRDVRLFIARLSGPPILVTMAFFEGFIHRYVAYLEKLAHLQGSGEFEYTNVHAVCDLTHREGLLRAFEAEAAFTDRPAAPSPELYEGVVLLRALIRRIAGARV